MKTLQDIFTESGYSLSSAIKKTNKVLIDILIKEKIVLVPIVTNECIGHIKRSDNRYTPITGPYYLTSEKIQSHITTELYGNKFYVNPINEKGLYSRIQELFQMSMIEIIGTHSIEYYKYSENGVDYNRSIVCYIIRLI